MRELTVIEIRDLLNKVIADGGADYRLYAGYDSNCAWAGFWDKRIVMRKKSKQVLFYE